MTGESVGVLMAGAAVKGVASATVRTFIADVITPYMRGMASKKSEIAIKDRLSRYAKLIEYKTRFVSTFASTSGLVAFEELYEPLKIRPSDKKGEFLIDAYPSDLFRSSRCVALTDDAGMGKSTLAKYIVRRAILEAKGIPLLIELRRLRSGQSILSCLCAELAGASLDSSDGLALMNLFERGNFIFILDGFDEIEEGLRSDVVNEINVIAARFQFCYFMLTSRPEYSVSLFPAFMQAEIVKLNREQAHSLIVRCDANRGIAKILIPRIDEAEVGEFLGSPLLVTLLYRAFDYRNSVPPKRTIFFRQVYDALFQDHDLAKGDAYSRRKECGLDSEDFHKLLRAIGFETFRSGRVSYGNDELICFIEKAIMRSGFKVEAKRVLQDVLKAVPLFQRDGTELKWSHKSFQEYFASQCILNDMGLLRPEIISKMFCSTEINRYKEIFRFFGEFDAGLIRELCVAPFLRKIESEAAGADFRLASIHCAVDIFYIAKIPAEHRSKMPAEILMEHFGVEISGRRTATAWGRKGSFLFVGVMKEMGLRFLLLPVIDRRMFPLYSSASRTSFALKFAQSLGNESRHVNPQIADLNAAFEAAGSIECIEAAASLFSISSSALDVVSESERKRIASLAPSVLDDF